MVLNARRDSRPEALLSVVEGNAKSGVTAERLRALPQRPGVYLMKDQSGSVIYVGKAKSLRSRVRSYFSGGDERASVPYLVERVHSIDTLVCESERQAILLESDLIKKYKPRYNIRLKDDKAYLLARIDLSAEWPRIELVRSSRDDGARYIGPFAFAYELRTVLEIIKRSVPLRTCADTVFRNRVRPCLEHQIKRCSGPCCLPISAEQYRAWVDQAIDILQGKNDKVLRELEHEMERASEELRFEDAATLRDRIQILRQVRSDRPRLAGSDVNHDAFGVYREGARVEVSILMVRQGRLFESKTFGFQDVEIPDDEILSAVVGQFYEGRNDVPEEILTPFELEDREAREEILRDQRGSRVKLAVPKIGSKAKLIELASANARENFAARFADIDVNSMVLASLQRELSLEEAPRIVQCVDISHFQGGSTVASVVSFLDGRPDKPRYRHFKLARQEGTPDDFASMREVVGRHLSRCAEENTLPDLLIIDGGLGQLNQAIEVRGELGLSRPVLVGLAKARTERLPYYAPSGAQPRRSQSFERVYVEGAKLPLILKPESEVTHLLERIRDEAHRFAITFHRKTRAKRSLKSALEDIPGVGERRRQDLLREYGSARAIAAANPQEVSERCRLPLLIAERVVQVLNRRLQGFDSSANAAPASGTEPETGD